MPDKLVRSRSGYKVVRRDTGRVVAGGKHYLDKQTALKVMRVRRAVEHGWKPTRGRGR